MPKKEENKPKIEDQSVDTALRPTAWDDYIGQDKIKANLKLIIEATKQRKESCDHLLFHGQAGLGKTTLAYIIAKELGANIKTTSGPALEKAGDIAAVLSNLEPYDVIFIDEVHRLNKLIEEILYPALESRKMHLIIGKGPSAKTLTIDLPPFTIIAATTKVSLLSNPLRSRFGAIFKLDYYSPNDIEKILNRSAKILNVGIENEAVKKLAVASRFTPRIANRLLKRARDYAQVNKQKLIDENTVQQTLAMFEIDNLGLEETDRRLLEIIIKKFNGGPVGVKTLAASLNEEEATVSEVYEPFLMSLGFLHRSSLGRIATSAAYKHLNIREKGELI